VKRRAVVVGAGIAGLAAAHSLTEIGYDVRLLEREAELRADGAGLTLWPNAICALEAIGLGDVVRESTREISTAVTLTPAGALLAEMPLDRIGERFGPLVSAHRADLLRALQQRVDSEIDFGAGVNATAGTLHTRGTPLEAELIIGADGIGSAVRAVVAPGVSPRPAGYAAWRGVAQTGHATPDRASETLGRGKRFGIVPLRANELIGLPF
jgi:2-polyprenyl-6-methoxyphenol hydroxylase-like FAD-dependent oxidoreductase